MVEKMLTKVFIFGLLYNFICTSFSQFAIQAYPPSDEKPEANIELINYESPKHDVIAESKKRDCGPTIISYKEKIPLLKKMLNDYSALAEKHNLDPADKLLLEDESVRVRNMTDDLIALFDPDLEKLRRMPRGCAVTGWCAREMNVYRKMKNNLTVAGKQFKEDVLHILNHTLRILQNSTAGTSASRYPEHVRDDYDKVLSRIVNWLFIVDIGTNIMRSTAVLVKKLDKAMELKLNLEKLWKITTDGKVEVPETNEIMYHDDEIKDEGFDEEMDREKKEITEDSELDTADKAAAEETGLLEKEGEAEAADEADVAEVGEVEESVDEAGEIFVPIWK